MALHVQAIYDFAHAAPETQARAEAFQRVVYSTFEESSDSVPALKAVTIIGLIACSLFAWSAIAAMLWQALA